MIVFAIGVLLVLLFLFNQSDDDDLGE